MDQGDGIIFTTLQEEVSYWKKVAQKCVEEKGNIQRDYDDFVSDSQQLEKEYEVTIDQNESTIRELRCRVSQVQKESDSYKRKSDTLEVDNISLITKLNESKDDNSRLKKYVRELEQKNDDLERAERTFAESIAGVESSLNCILERNAMLESEIDEKETMKVKLQRLVDETRDLKQELQLKERCPDNDRPITTNGHATDVVDTNRCSSVAAVQTQTTPLKRDPINNINNVNGTVESQFSPSTRILALNIVGDLLRKVGLSRLLCDECGTLKCTECPKKVGDFSKPRVIVRQPYSTTNSSTDIGNNIDDRGQSPINNIQAHMNRLSSRNRHRSRGRTSSAVQNYTK